MEILRVPPYPLSISYSVQVPEANHVLIIKDSTKDIVKVEEIIESTASGKLNYTLPESFSRYDDSYYLAIYEYPENSLGEIVVEDTLNIIRPYVDPNTLGTTASEISEYKTHERLARAIIDSITGGFYFQTKDLEVTGDGTDYISLWDRAYKILTVYKNGQLVYDASQDPAELDEYSYFITKDKTAITANLVGYTDAINRAESAPVGLAVGESDSFEIFGENDGLILAYKRGVFFYEGVDYIFEIEYGYKVVPYDIQEATRMLIEDIKCGKLEYFKRYVGNYSTDQYRIQIDKRSFDGTGNIIVDKILDKYVTSMKKPGVL